jgi:GNAT superfamily N-acetyltransferase
VVSKDDAIVIRASLRPGDLGAIVGMHGDLYAREFGFDATFEAYVAGPLAAFAFKRSPRERIWIAERGDRTVGTVAIVEAAQDVAQLRWFLVDPESRGRGLGTTLLERAIEFGRQSGYDAIVLSTVNTLEAAARLYRATGFRLIEEERGVRWGVEIVEQRYERSLRR